MKRILWMVIAGIVGAGMPETSMAGYEGQDAEQARQILAAAEEGGKYYPHLQGSADAGHADRYQGEMGVVVLVKNPELLEVLKKGNEIAYPDPAQRPSMMPHITLMQGRFSDDYALRTALVDVAAAFKGRTITMSAQFVKGGGGNTFLDVYRQDAQDSSDSWLFFEQLNAVLCKKIKPAGPMKQVLDAIKEETADLKEMHDGGQWRDFNIPRANRPHITAVYGKQDDALLLKLNALLADRSFTFEATDLSTRGIDERGNLYETAAGSMIFNTPFAK